MELTFNDTLSRYEFRCTRDEKDTNGHFAVALATTARFKTQWHGREPVFVTTDPYKALELSVYASYELRQRITSEVQTKGEAVPVLTFKNGVYIWSGPSHRKDGFAYKDIPKRAGFAFTRTPYKDLPHGAGSALDEPVWWTEQTTKAAVCAEYADESAAAVVGEFMGRRHAALQASRAEDSDIDIAVPEGLTPYGYQKAGVAYAAAKMRFPAIRGVLIGDEMGLGKTIQAALLINYIQTIKSVLIICPASLKRNWMRELERWLVRPATIGIADTKYNQVVPATDIVIINYDILARREFSGKTKVDRKTDTIKKVYEYHLRESLRKKWDLVVVDEAHRLKGDPKTVIRARMTFSLQCGFWLMLTGTPLVNKPRELWNLAHLLAPKAFSSKAEFMNRYCKGGNPRFDPYAGATNLQELQDKLRLQFMVRRLKRDVLKDLPPKMRQVIELPADGCEQLVRDEMLAFTRKEDVLTNMRLRVELAKASDNPADYKNAVAKLTQGIQVAFEELSRIRRETAIAKIPVVTEHVGAILSEGQKVILFCHHKEVVRKIAEAFKSETVTLTGDTSLRDRDKAVTEFQTNEQVRLFIGTIGAAGVGLTLTASSIVVFAELDWVPGNVTQAEDRAHRIGQQDNVLVQHLVLEGSLDKRMADVLVEKQDIADRALDRESVDELMGDPILPDRETMATQGVTVKDVAKLAEKITRAEIAAVQMGLQMLAGTHPDAHLIDGLTFRDIDAPLGKTLAGEKNFTPRMAALGKKFLSRYRNTQLGEMLEIKRLFTKEGKES